MIFIVIRSSHQLQASLANLHINADVLLKELVMSLPLVFYFL